METNECDSETERVTCMLKWTFAAVMILGLSTISPAAQAPVFLYDYSLEAQPAGESGDVAADESPAPEETAAAPEASGYTEPEPGVSAAETTLSEVADSGAPAPEFAFETINGVAMDVDLSEVLAVLGEPTERTTDELLGTEEYHYPGMTVGLYEGLVDYVVVPASAGSVRIGDTETLLELAQLRELLGEPDLVADDGLVYVRGPFALKLFTDAEGSALSTMEVFWASS